MSYFKINNIDFSNRVSDLKVDTQHNYNSQQNAAGNTVVDYINSKRVIEVGIIALNEVDMTKLLSAVKLFNVKISFRNPLTNALEEGVDCIIPNNCVEYYTIHGAKATYKALTLKFVEL